VTPSTRPPSLDRRLGPLDSAAVIVSNVIGGGIFLTPLLLFFGWAGARQASGLTAPFILLNSMAGLAGNVVSLKSLPAEMPWFMLAAVLGTAVGTQLGIRWFSVVALQRMLAVVVLVAAGKFLLT